jgi:protein-S-isoprenylcysteine O-methyltransferase Ste14
MLTGIFLVMFGTGFWIGSISLIFIFTPLFILINIIELKKIEEPELEIRLGKEYIEYKKRTPMFFPDLSKLLKFRR